MKLPCARNMLFYDHSQKKLANEHHTCVLFFCNPADLAGRHADDHGHQGHSAEPAAQDIDFAAVVGPHRGTTDLFSDKAKEVKTCLDAYWKQPGPVFFCTGCFLFHIAAFRTPFNLYHAFKQAFVASGRVGDPKNSCLTCLQLFACDESFRLTI